MSEHIDCPHCGEEIVLKALQDKEFNRSEYFGEWPPPERCDYGSCGMAMSHLGPHRCGACGRPCDDPEVTCEVHKAGWARKPEWVERESQKIADWSSGLNARLAQDD